VIYELLYVNYNTNQMNLFLETMVPCLAMYITISELATCPVRLFPAAYLGSVAVRVVSPLVVVGQVVDGNEDDVLGRRLDVLPKVVSARSVAPMMSARPQLQRGRRDDRHDAARRRLRNVHSKQQHHRVLVASTRRLDTTAPRRRCMYTRQISIINIIIIIVSGPDLAGGGPGAQFTWCH